MRRTTTELKKNYFNGASDRVFPPPRTACQNTRGTHQSVSTLARRHQCLDNDGVCCVGQLISEDQLYINKYSPVNTKDPVLDPNQLDVSHYRPTPSKYKVSEAD